jgi:hypothetical protein
MQVLELMLMLTNSGKRSDSATSTAGTDRSLANDELAWLTAEAADGRH